MKQSSKDVRKEQKIGGLLLVIAIITLFITIFFEIKIGWIGSPDSQDPDWVPRFINENWDGLKTIWGWQAFATFLFTLAYFQLSSIKRSVFWVPIGFLWSISFLLSLLVLVSFGLTLGAYGPASSIYEESPMLFTSIRGGVLGLYGFGGVKGQLVFLLILIFEMFSKDGMVPKIPGFIVIGLMIFSIVLVVLSIIPGKMLGLVFLLMPLILGYFYATHTTTSQTD